MEDFTPQYKLQHPEIKTHLASDLMKLGGEAWKGMSIPARQPYIQKYKERKREYDQWLNSGGKQMIEAMEKEEEKMEREAAEAAVAQKAVVIEKEKPSVFDFQGRGLAAAAPAAPTIVHASAFLNPEQQGEASYSLQPQKEHQVPEEEEEEVLEERRFRKQQLQLQLDQPSSLPAPPPAEQLVPSEDIARQRQATELRFEQALQAGGFSLDDIEVKKVIAAAAAASMAQQQGKRQQQQRHVAPAPAWTATATAEPSPPSSIDVAAGPAAVAPAATALHPGLPPLPLAMRPASRTEAVPVPVVPAVAAAQTHPSSFMSHVIETQTKPSPQETKVPMPLFSPPAAARPAFPDLSPGRLLPAPPLEVDLQRQQSFAQRIQLQIDQELAKLRNFMILPTAAQQQQQTTTTAVEAGVASVPSMLFPAGQQQGVGGVPIVSSRPQEQQHAEPGLPLPPLQQQQQPQLLAAAAATTSQGPTQLQLAQQRLEMIEELQRSFLQETASTEPAVAAVQPTPPPQPQPPSQIPDRSLLPALQPTLPSNVLNVDPDAPAYVQLPPMFGDTSGLGTVFTLPAAGGAPGGGGGVVGTPFPTTTATAAAVVPLAQVQGFQAQQAPQVSGIPLHVFLQQLGYQIQPQQQQQHQQQQVSEEDRQEFQQNQMMLLQVMQNTQQLQQQQLLESTTVAFPTLTASLPAFGGGGGGGGGAVPGGSGYGSGAFQNVNLLVAPPPFPILNTTTMATPRVITTNLNFAAPEAQVQAPSPPAPSQDASSLHGHVQQQQQPQQQEHQPQHQPQPPPH